MLVNQDRKPYLIIKRRTLNKKTPQPELQGFHLMRLFGRSLFVNKTFCNDGQGNISFLFII